MKMQLAEVARALNIEAKEEWEDISITSVCFDSRKIESGALFIPLVAENDGHKYVNGVLNRLARSVRAIEIQGSQRR